MTEQPATDMRGIVRPDAMLRVVDFARDEPGEVLEGLVEWFWSVAWDLSEGQSHDQEVLTHPAGNISIGTIDDAGVPLAPAEGRVYGVQTRMSRRHLTVAGWTVAARTSVGGLGALLDAPARSITDARRDLGAALPGLDEGVVLRSVRREPTNEARVDVLRDALTAMVERRDPALVAEARDIVAVARHAEVDRSIRRVEQLASVAGVSVRSLQRLFDQHVGVSPAFVIRRWRIIETAEAARLAITAGAAWPGWATLAAEIGYADQAHLTRDFTRHIGVSPAAYAVQCAG